MSTLKRLRSEIDSFWREHPALLLGLSLLVGASSFLFWETPWNYGFFLLWVLYLVSLKKIDLAIPMAAIGLYSWFLYGEAPTLERPRETTARFAIHSLKPHHSPFQKGVLFEGTIYIKEGAFPCSVYHRGKNRPKANVDYHLKGTLAQRGAYDYLFKPKEWREVKKSWSLSEARFKIKERFRKFLASQLSPKTASFLSSLITGDVEDRLLRYEFSKLGLQHILAISGFHFGVLIAFFSFVLSFALPRFWKYIVLMTALTLYFAFVGPIPAVERSWLTAQLYLGAKLLRRETSPLNLLGCSMALELCIHPLVCGQIGFQLSFLSCGGILLLHPFFEKKVRNWLPKREAEEIYELNGVSKHVYLLSCFLRQAISLTLAVNTAILPLLLYHFHEFPLLSIFYNLFFPFGVSIVLFLTLLALFFSLVCSPIAYVLFAFVEMLTHQLLDLASHAPRLLDRSILLTNFPPWAIPLYLFVLFSLALRRRKTDPALTFI